MVFRSFGRRIANRAADLVVDVAVRGVGSRMNKFGLHPVSYRNPTGFKSRISKNKSLAEQLKALQKHINRMAPEIKYLDVNSNLTNITGPGSIAQVNVISQGDSVGTRTGNTVRMKSLNLKGKFNAESLAAVAPDAFMQCFLIRDRQTEGSTAVVPSVSEIFNPVECYQNMLSISTLSRFEILWSSKMLYPRRWYWVTAMANLPTPTDTPYIEADWKGDMELQYSGTTGADMEKNSIYFVILTSDSTGTGAVDFVGNIRIGFVDS